MVCLVWNKLAVFLLNYVMGQVIKPALDYLFQKGKNLIKKRKIKKAVKKLEKADNENDFNNSFDDLP